MLLMDTKLFGGGLIRNGFMELFLNTFLQYNINQLNWGNDDCKGEELGRGQYY